MNWYPIFAATLLLMTSTAAATTPAEPAPPMALVATVDGNTAHLDWQAPLDEGASPLQGYHIYRFVNTTREFVASVPASTTSYQDTGLAAGTSYIYYVTGYNEDGESAPSNPSPSYPYCPVVEFDTSPPDVNVYPDCLEPIPIVGKIIGS